MTTALPPSGMETAFLRRGIGGNVERTLKPSQQPLRNALKPLSQPKPADPFSFASKQINRLDRKISTC